MARTPSSSSDAPKTKQSTLMGFFGKPKAGPIPRSASSTSNGASSTPMPTRAVPTPSVRPASSAPSATNSTSSPLSSALKTPNSGTGPGSSPLTAGGTRGKRQESPLKKQLARGAAEGDGGEDEDLTPPPELMLGGKGKNERETGKKQGLEVDETMDVDETEVAIGEPDSPPVMTGRRAGKRKVVYAESDASSEEDLPSKSGRARPRKSLKQSDDDDFEFDDEADAAFAAIAEEYEQQMAESPSPSVRTASPPPRKATKAKAKPTSFLASASVSRSAQRPGPRPSSTSHSAASVHFSAEGECLTEAERRRAVQRQEASEKDSAFPFLNPAVIRDGQQRRPSDPDYDKRTLYIPKKDLDTLKPFEKQFWNIKKNHFDTVLFFQKGKFYELYEGDAKIGHEEFQLKLTDRVRMKMVGVPEQSLELWTSKFVGSGHKVGRVDQSETAIGAELRLAAEPKGKAAKGKKKSLFDDDDEDGGGGGGGGNDKMVRRELKRVFTAGTIVDAAYLTSDDANYCASIKEYKIDGQPPSFGVCIVDASTADFRLTAFADDVCLTKLETLFRQLRPTELLHAKNNLSVETQRLLRNTLPGSTQWQSFRDDDSEFCSADKTLDRLRELYETEDDAPGSKPELPASIEPMLDNALALEALGGMLFYLDLMQLGKDLVGQDNFNVYDPLKEGKCLLLDGQTLSHMEVFVNNEGGTEGTLLELMSLCSTPFGKRLFRFWLQAPLRDIPAINARLDAVEDLMKYATFTGTFTTFARSLPDLERLISRIHARSVKHSEFAKVVQAFETVQENVEELSEQCEHFDSQSVSSLLRGAPDLKAMIKRIRGMFSKDQDESSKTMSLVPRPGADQECDDADEEVLRLERTLDDMLKSFKKKLGTKEIEWWNSAQGGKEIYQLQVPATVKVPMNWSKQGGTKHNRYYDPTLPPVIKELQMARETRTAARRAFFGRLQGEFDKDRTVWLRAVKAIAELDCLVSLAKASSNMDEPRCRPEFVEADSAFINFEALRHPSMCLRADFIANDVQLGGQGPKGSGLPRQVLLTGPNMAGKSTLLRMTAAGIILAQLGCYVPAKSAVLAPVDKIQTRMGAYDNMFSNASTFKVELDECSRILREAGPKSFVVLDELGRGTSTYDGMAIAGAVLHHLATHTLPLGFFATHYGSLTDDFSYHPNIRRMHMQTHVDDGQLQVVFLYKLIPGVAESSHGTHVARMAGVKEKVVRRADQVSAEFFEAFKSKMAARRRSALPLVALADFAWLMKLARQAEAAGSGVGGGVVDGGVQLGGQLDVVRRAVAKYAT